MIHLSVGLEFYLKGKFIQLQCFSATRYYLYAEGILLAVYIVFKGTNSASIRFSFNGLERLRWVRIPYTEACICGSDRSSYETAAGLAAAFVDVHSAVFFF